MKTILAAFAAVFAVAAVAAPAHAQYNRSAGQSAPATEVQRVEKRDASRARAAARNATPAPMVTSGP